MSYTLNIAGLTRELPLCSVNESLDIAAFIMFSDVELTVETSKALLAKCPECDVILTAETKGIPLAYEMARQSGADYAVARKSVKLYMRNPVSVEVKSITTFNTQRLYLDDSTVSLIKGRRVLLLDDVISTGASVSALMELTKMASGTAVGIAAALAEGDAAKREDIIFLEKLPLFWHTDRS
ncbi:MAG: adenine phosphoribosyltransferase [Oscillospiraceae bacterium]|jgi:adenine phosphoribosyltransferase|nr:adenine phosphoribosyltransferase [Oscillospiraceae bacterium]